MPAFAITVDSPNPQLRPDRTGQVSFTVTNKSPGKIKGQALIVCEDKTQADWVKISDGDVRDFDFDGAQQFVVRITVPAGAPGGTCKFRFNMQDPQRGVGEENSVAGPTVAVTVPAPAVPPPPPPFPWWIVAVAGAVVLLAIGGVVAWRMTRLPGAGEACKDGQCASGLWCPDKTCLVDKTGNDCKSAADCDGQPCAGICMRKVGEPCDANNNLAWAMCESLFCKQGHCASSENGDSCQHSEQCKSKNCQTGVCAAVAVAGPSVPAVSAQVLRAWQFEARRKIP